MKASHRRRTSRRPKTPWFVLGAVLGATPQLHGAEKRTTPPALPIEHRIGLHPRRIEFALAHVRVRTPSETLLLSPRADGSIEYILEQFGPPPSPTAAAESGMESEAQTAPVFRFAIAPGPLANALKQFETVTGLKLKFADDVVGQLTTDGVSGTYTASQALDRLLAGTGPLAPHDRRRRRLDRRPDRVGRRQRHRRPGTSNRPNTPRR